jgi:predicted permease
LDEEIRFHVEAQTAKNIRDGMTVDQARRSALIRFGAVEESKEQARDAFRVPVLEDSLREFRYGLRALRRTPGFTLAAVLTLALGIGGTTAVFGLVYAVLLKPLPYPAPDELVAVWHDAKGVDSADINMSAAQYFTYREQNRVFQSFGVWSDGAVNVTGLAEPERILSVRVTSEVLPTLGTGPLVGRWFTPQDDTNGAPATAILAHGYWRRRFGSDARVVGKTLNVDGIPRQIIGVMPKEFRFVNVEHELILPLQFDRAAQKLAPFNYSALARLKPGVSMADASADVARLVPIFLKAWPENGPGFVKMLENARFTPNLRPLKQDVVGNVGEVLWVLMGTIGIVLVIACANVANLVLVRVEGRQQELAVRTALGAGWKRIARALLLENVALALMGGLLGVLFAFGVLRLLVAIAPSTLPRLDEITIDPAVVAFAAALSLVSVLLFGLIPILRHARPKVASNLRAGGRTATDSVERQRVRNAFLIGQVALSLVLLVGSGLMIRTFLGLRGVQPGFARPDTVQLARIAIPGGNGNPDRTVAMLALIRDRFAAIPGVSEVAFAGASPMNDGGGNDMIVAEDQSYKPDHLPPIRHFEFVAPGFFSTVGTPLVAGRDIAWADVQTRRPVVVISENMALEMWGGPAAALGKRVREHPRSPWREIVGVVGNVYRRGVHAAPPATVYWPIALENFWGNRVYVRDAVTFALRTDRAGSELLASEMRDRLSSVNAGLPLAQVETLKEVYTRSMARTSFALVMLAIAAGTALLLAVVGVYAVIAYAVARRRREIGIRMALGAQRIQLTRTLMWQGLSMVGVGIALGLAAAVPLTRVMRSLLFGVGPLDPITYVVVLTAVAATAALASYIPARRTTSVDPVDALRAE